MLQQELRSHSVYATVLYTVNMLQDLVWLIVFMCCTCTIKFCFTSTTCRQCLKELPLLTFNSINEI